MSDDWDLVLSDEYAGQDGDRLPVVLNHEYDKVVGTAHLFRIKGGVGVRVDIQVIELKTVIDSNKDLDFTWAWEFVKGQKAKRVIAISAVLKRAEPRGRGGSR